MTTMIDGVTRCVENVAAAVLAGDVDAYVRWANGALSLLASLDALGGVPFETRARLTESIVEAGASLGCELRMGEGAADADRPDYETMSAEAWLAEAERLRSTADTGGPE